MNDIAKKEEVIVKHMEACAEELRELNGLDYLPHFLSVVLFKEGSFTISSMPASMVQNVLEVQLKNNIDQPVEHLMGGEGNHKLQS